MSLGKGSDGSFEGGYTPTQPVLDYWCDLIEDDGDSSAFCLEPVSGDESEDPEDAGTEDAASDAQGQVDPSSVDATADDGTAQPDASAGRRRALKGGRRRMRRRIRRRLEDGEGPEAVKNPVLCVKAGAVVLFSVSWDEETGEGRYPKYVKDSILNTNQDFDRAPFDELAQLVKS